jgi:hypothetical protein
MQIRFLALLLFAGATSVLAEESRPILRGTEGLVALPFRAHNEGQATMTCSVALAHWYSLDFGTAAAGGSVQATLWRDPASGETYVLNAKQDRMPIQALWCGLAGRSWATRASIPLPGGSDRRTTIAIDCARDGARLACH